MKNTETKTEDISDGYHTFKELYQHRVVLFLALAKKCGGWKSKKHNDETMFDGMFIVGIGKEKGEQITYHLEHYDFDFEKIELEELEKAPEFDGHTGEDVLARISSL